MSWIRVEVDSSQVENWLRELERISEFTNAEYSMVADSLRSGILYNFEQEAAPDGRRWERLAPFTVWQREQGIDHRGIPFSVDGEGPMLQRTGDLRDSFTREGHPNHIQEVNVGGRQTTIEIGAQDAHDTPRRIELLHEGSSLFNIPPRPWVGLSEPAKGNMYQTIFKILDHKLRSI